MSGPPSAVFELPGIFDPFVRKREVGVWGRFEAVRFSHQPSTSYLFEKDAQFLLFYKEGIWETKEGICPKGSNLEWLKLFQTTLSDSFKDMDGRLKLKIQGFASVAPVRVNGIIDSTLSNLLNCEIANQRAEALIYFLTLGDSKYDQESCKAVLDSKEYAEGGTWPGTNFDVSYKPWESYEEMKPNKPEKGNSPQSRQRDIEFRNRSVQIIIE